MAATSSVWRTVCASAAPALLAATLLAGCNPKAVTDPAVIRVSAIPDQLPNLVQEQHRALIERVCGLAGLQCRWVPSVSYEALDDNMARGEVDLAYFGGATFVQAAQRHDAVPLVMRDIDFRFTSLVVVRRDDPAVELKDLAGRRFSFGPRSSTSGHYMLRQKLAAADIVPERLFGSVGFSANHDATMRAVADGEIDAGGVNASVFYRRLAAGDASATRLRVLWQSRPYTDYVWAVRPQLSEALRVRLTDAFLDLSATRPEDAGALRAESSAGFVPAFAEDFDEVRHAVESQGMLMAPPAR